MGENESMIYKAGKENLEMVTNITRKTITEIYPKYYANGVVEFFLKHHCEENINRDIENGLVWLLKENEIPIGTITLKNNVINRLFVLPEYQGKGYGSQLMDFAEEKIGREYDRVHIDSSLPAKEMYLKRGYKETNTCHIKAEKGAILVYDEMVYVYTTEVQVKGDKYV